MTAPFSGRVGTQYARLHQDGSAELTRAGIIGTEPQGEAERGDLSLQSGALDGRGRKPGDIAAAASGDLRVGIRADLADEDQHTLPVVTAQGLGAAITSLTHRYPIPVSIDIPAKRWSTVTEATAYFVISEALANVTKHAHARLVTVRVAENHGCLRVDVCDDGIGGVTAATPGPTGAVSGGLPGLADRVAALGGSFQVLSRPAEGTMLRVDLPCG